MSKTVIFINSDNLQDIANDKLEVEIAEKTNFGCTVISHVILTFSNKSFNDLSTYLYSNLENIDIIICTKDCWIACKLK
jgi:hypothetical protein